MDFTLEIDSLQSYLQLRNFLLATVMTSSEPASSTLLPEILGFHPQLLLDDIINAANEPIYQCTEFVSAFMVGWATERKQQSKKDQEDVSKEIEQVNSLLLGGYRV